MSPTSIRAMIDGEDRPATRIEALRDRIVGCLDVDLAEHGRLALNELLEEIETLGDAFNEYSAHQSWRCQYRSRYGKCVCGLDDFVAAYGLEPVPVDDPEAKK